MNFTPYDLEDIKYEKRKHRNYTFLKSFVESELSCAKVENISCKTAEQQVCSFNTSIKRYGFNHIKTVRSGQDIFLVNTALVSEV